MMTHCSKYISAVTVGLLLLVFVLVLNGRESDSDCRKYHEAVQNYAKIDAQRGSVTDARYWRGPTHNFLANFYDYHTPMYYLVPLLLIVLSSLRKRYMALTGAVVFVTFIVGLHIVSWSAPTLLDEVSLCTQFKR